MHKKREHTIVKGNKKQRNLHCFNSIKLATSRVDKSYCNTLTKESLAEHELSLFHPILTLSFQNVNPLILIDCFVVTDQNHLEFAIILIVCFFINFSLSTNPLFYTLICNSNPFILNMRSDRSPINDLFLLLEPSSKTMHLAWFKWAFAKQNLRKPMYNNAWSFCAY